MNVLSFISTLVQALAWPIAVIILAILFREQLSNFISALANRVKDLRRARGFGAEVEFDNELMDLKEKVDQLPKVTVPAGDTTVSDDPSVGPEPEAKNSDFFDSNPDIPQDEFTRKALGGQFAGLAQESPEGAVLGAWQELENNLKGLAETLNIDEKDVIPMSFAISQELPNLASELSVVNRLYRLRNSVAHGTQITKLEAYDYAVTAHRLAMRLYVLTRRRRIQKRARESKVKKA